jgi:vitamin K-dependent gamma-carboxylase
MPPAPSILAKIRERAFAPVDIASLVFFRVAFGLVMVAETILLRNQIAGTWIHPRFLFNYYGFSWVQPWPENGLYLHWTLLGIFAAFVAAGLFYRFSAALLCLSCTYFFLLDEGRYVNHTYLMCLFGFLLIFVPANRAFSIDVLINPKSRSETTPAWAIWVLRAQMAVVYFFAGIAKISPDWLRGEPMRHWLTRNIHSSLIDNFSHANWTPYVASYGALLLDLLAAPLLLWRRTRLFAFWVVVIFHILNEQFFPIGVFPWLAIAATTIFLSPSWPRRVLSVFRFAKPSSPSPKKLALPSRKKQNLILGFVVVYVAIQIFVPLAHFFYPGGIEWTYAEHHFAWQMMLRRQTTTAFFYVTDPNNGETQQVKTRDYLDSRQIARMGWRPDMVEQFAKYLARVTMRAGPEPLKVYARIFVSINGRKPQLFLDPNVDLAAEPHVWGRPRWLLQIHDPLPPPGEDHSKEIFASSPEGH